MAEILKFDPRRGRLVSRQADRARRAMIVIGLALTGAS